jgi:hypothetical protein
MKHIIPLILILSFIQSCGMPMGNRVDAENLKVYYMDGVEKEQAIRFARYWRDNGFIGDRPQYIQLSKDEKGLILVKLIEREFYREDELTIIELSLIQQLQRDLAKDVFEQEVEILITGDRF